jgi:manganese/zinc/iron transport system permease protein
MSASVYTFVSYDLPVVLVTCLAALACGLLGNFLVLRRMSLMGDAISHAVLPGLVGAFLIAGTRHSWPMFIGAAVGGLATVLLVEGVRTLGRLESGAAMGVVFSVLFALGVVLLQQAEAADHVDLDADCVLYGQLETIDWWPPEDLSEWTWQTLREVPRQVTTLAALTAVVVAFIALFFKELRLTSFDPSLATALGIPAWRMHIALMVLVAGATVASFEAVGSILVVAMLICPAATARLLTDRLLTQVVLSGVLSLVAGLGGYVLGAHAPIWLGFEDSVSLAGSMAVLAGVQLALAVVFSPWHGVVPRQVRRARHGLAVAVEDVLGVLYRFDEAGRKPAPAEVRRALGAGARRGIASRLGTMRARRLGLIERRTIRLTDAGRSRARGIIRTHRLWESYMVRELGIRADHAHDPAERLEHLGDETGRFVPPVDAQLDPHQRPIPPGDGAV